MTFTAAVNNGPKDLHIGFILPQNIKIFSEFSSVLFVSAILLIFHGFFKKKKKKEEKLLHYASLYLFLEPHASTLPRVTFSQTQVRTEEGSFTQLPCVAQGNPPPTYR